MHYSRGQFTELLRCDGQWLISNPAADVLVCSEPPSAGLLDLLQRMLCWVERPRSSSAVIQWLHAQGVPPKKASTLLQAFIDAALLVPEDSEYPWSDVAARYNSMKEVIRFVSFRKSVRFVDYADPEVLQQDRQNMEDFERAEPPPTIYKNYQGAPQINLDHPATSSPHDAFSRLSHLLFWGYGKLREVYFHQLPALLKPVPSMGARHPFEAYVLVEGNDMLNSGIYHYRVETHALERISAGGKDGASCGFVGRERIDNPLATTAILITTVIFDRFQWRYRHAWNYKDIYYDFGHVSATLKFVAGELGIGLKPAVSEPSLPGTAPLTEEIIAVHRLEYL